MALEWKCIVLEGRGGGEEEGELDYGQGRFCLFLGPMQDAVSGLPFCQTTMDGSLTF